MIMAQVFSDSKRPTVTYCGNAELANPGITPRQVFTFLGQFLGSESARRTIVVGIARRGYSVATEGVTVSGESAYPIAIYTPAGSGSVEMWAASIQTGTSGTIIVTMSGAIEGVVSITTWALYDLRSITPQLIYGTEADSAEFSLSAPRHSIVLALAMIAPGAGVTSTFTWSGITADYSQPVHALGRIARSAAHMTVTSVPSDFSVDYATPTNQRAIAASFR